MVKTYCFDIDGTICSNTDGDYENAKPFSSRIELVNKLFHEGHNIVYFTARGSTTGIDWKDFTKNQLKVLRNFGKRPQMISSGLKNLQKY